MTTAIPEFTTIRPAMYHLAKNYAAKIYAESEGAENPTPPDLTDSGIVFSCKNCVPVRFSEAHIIRNAYMEMYR